MGICFPRKSIYTKLPQLKQWKGDFDSLMVVDSDLERLWKLFTDMDADVSGEIDLVELIHYLRLERTKFNKRVFTIFDEDGSGEIDFREFVVALWNYCTMGKSALTLFAFDLYDTDGSGEIELDEVERMLKEVYGKAFKTSKVAQQLLYKLTITCGLHQGGSLSVERFNHFCTKHPGLLFPAFKFQMELQEKLCGKAFWDRAARTRVKLSNGANLTVQQLLMAHVSESAFNEVTRHDSKSAIAGRKEKKGLARIIERMDTAHQNTEGRVRRGNILDAMGVLQDPVHVLDPQGNPSHNVDPKLQPTQFSDFAMNTGSVSDRRARRGINVEAKTKLKALAAFTSHGRAGALKRGAVLKRPGRAKPKGKPSKPKSGAAGKKSSSGSSSSNRPSGGKPSGGTNRAIVAMKRRSRMQSARVQPK